MHEILVQLIFNKFSLFWIITLTFYCRCCSRALTDVPNVQVEPHVAYKVQVDTVVVLTLMQVVVVITCTVVRMVTRATSLIVHVQLKKLKPKFILHSQLKLWSHSLSVMMSYSFLQAAKEMLFALILKPVLVEQHVAKDRLVNIRAVHSHKQAAVKMEFTVAQMVSLVIPNKGCAGKILKQFQWNWRRPLNHCRRQTLKRNVLQKKSHK